MPDGTDAAALLRGQLAVSQRGADDTITAYTGVQIPGVLDDLYADAVDDLDLGVTFSRQQADLPALGADGADRVAADLERPSTGSGTGATEPVRHEATWDAASGTWTVKGKADLKGDEYLWEVVVYAPTTGAIETNAVTDPYSVALTENSERSVAVDLADKQWRPKHVGEDRGAGHRAARRPCDLRAAHPRLLGDR